MRTLLVCTAAVTVFAAGQTLAATPEPKTEDEKALYALGVAISQSVASFDLTPAELELVKAGFSDGVLRKPKLEPSEYFPKLQEMQSARTAAAGKAVLDKAAAEQGARRTPSGLVIRTIKEGTGASPKAADTVKVHYHGTLPDGRVFDSSIERNEPATFPLNGVIACWTEALQMMKVGGKSKLTCPASLAYG
ncbi:MAG TPA: FKBP-type peptidyl-prolyl cis-trans isomerase, partial [Steroidobacter sp.]